VVGQKTNVRRRLGRAALVLVLAVICVVAALPAIMSSPAFHRVLTTRLTKDIAGNLTVDRMRLRWNSDPEIDGLRFSAPDNRPVLVVDECRCERSLFQLVTDRSTFGTIRFVRPTLYLLINKANNNIAAAVRPKTEREFISDRVEDLRKLGEKISGKIQIKDGRFVFQSAADRPKIELAPYNVRLAVHPTANGAGRRVVMEPGEVFHEIELTQDLCNDLIKYAAPVLARNTWVKGSVSLSTDGGVFPIDDLAQSTMSGRLTLHEITAGPGPIVTEIARVLEVADEIRLVDQSAITFKLANRQVSHQGLRFQIGQFAVETEGTVHQDETIKLVARIHFPEVPKRSGELARRFAGRELQIPVGGTLDDPRIDWAAMLEDHPFLDPFIQRVLDPDDTPVLDLLRDIQQRRSQRLQGANPPSGDEPRPLARRLLQNFLGRDLLDGDTGDLLDGDTDGDTGAMKTNRDKTGDGSGPP
jgi:hypothetical protein